MARDFQCRRPTSNPVPLWYCVCPCDSVRVVGNRCCPDLAPGFCPPLCAPADTQEALVIVRTRGPADSTGTRGCADLVLERHLSHGCPEGCILRLLAATIDSRPRASQHRTAIWYLYWNSRLGGSCSIRIGRRSGASPAWRRFLDFLVSMVHGRCHHRFGIDSHTALLVFRRLAWSESSCWPVSCIDSGPGCRSLLHICRTPSRLFSGCCLCARAILDPGSHEVQTNRSIDGHIGAGAHRHRQYG